MASEMLVPVAVQSEILEPWKDKPNLDYSRPLDVHKWSEYPEVNAFVQQVCVECLSVLGNKNKKKLHKHVKVVVLDLYVACLQSASLYVAYTRDKNNFNCYRYRKLHLSGEMLVEVVDALCLIGYIENHIGVNFEKFKRQSRMRATKKFVRLALGYSIKISMVYRACEVICLRNEDKNDEEFTETRKTKKMRADVESVNRLICGSKIGIILSFKDELDIVRRMRMLPDFSRNCYRRVFNNSSFSDGGRWYGHWSQSIPREYRRRIQIDGESVCELDYSGLHIRMLYCMKGLPQPEGDVYEIDGYRSDKRGLIKVVLQAIINANNPGKANQGAAKDARDKGMRLQPGEVGQIAEKLILKHRDISEYFCSGVGVKLQYMDSEMALYILKNMAALGIVCLPIHDSFIVQTKHADKLREAMVDSFFARFGVIPKIDRKY